jgi:hypothetical protein
MDIETVRFAISLVPVAFTVALVVGLILIVRK